MYSTPPSASPPSFPQTTAPQPAEQTASLHTDALTPASPHRNCILVFGPGVPPKVIADAEKDCLERGFTVETFHTAGLPSTEDLRLQLHANQKLGPQTQVVLVFHGSRDERGRHMLTLTDRGQQQGLAPTVETLRALRRTDAGEAAPGANGAWGGTMHLVTCEGGALEQEILPGDGAWQEGNYLVYAGKDRLLVHEGMRAITQLFDFLSQCRNQDIAPDPGQMLAYAAHRAGDGIALMGKAVQSPVVVQAPALTPENMLQFHAGEWLKHQTYGAMESMPTVEGQQAGEKDANEARPAMPTLAGATAVELLNIHEDKLRNVLLSAVGHQDIQTVALLLAARPDLAEARMLTGETVEELAWRDGNLAIIDALLGARMDTVGAVTVLLQACARSDYQTSLRLLARAPQASFAEADLALAMELNSFNIARSDPFFEALMNAAKAGGNHLTRQCMDIALEWGYLPTGLARQWRDWDSAHAQQRLDDARLLKVGAADASQAPLALASACREGDVTLLKMLLQRFPLGADNPVDRRLLAQLSLARENAAELLGELLGNSLLCGDDAMFHAVWRQAGGKQVMREQGSLLLNQACMSDQVKVARYLLNIVHIDQGPDAYGDTPLHLAASCDSQKVLPLLLGMKPELDRKNQAGDTALHIACRAGHDEMAKQLVAAGADIGIKDARGETALEIAEAACSPDTLALLGKKQD